MGVKEKLLAVQTELKSPKNQYNSFGKYYYRSCEDILEGLKPVLGKYKATLFITDSIEKIDTRFYVKATATFLDIETDEKIENTAYARESDNKKGMDESQVTGATSSYARKYALNGLFLIDDTKDYDTDEYQVQQMANDKATKSDEIKNQQMIDSVDKNMLPNGGGVTKEQLDKIKSEMNRTGILENVVLSMFGVNSIEKLTNAQAIAVLNKFAKTPDKKDVS